MHRSCLLWPSVFHYMMCSHPNLKGWDVRRTDAARLGLWFGEIKCWVSVIYICWEVAFIVPAQMPVTAVASSHTQLGWPNWGRQAGSGRDRRHHTICHCYPKCCVLGDYGPRQLAKVAWEASAEQKVKLRFLRLVLPDPFLYPHVVPLVFINSWAV